MLVIDCDQCTTAQRNVGSGSCKLSGIFLRRRGLSGLGMAASWKLYGGIELGHPC